jgi:hypothetical protein
MVPGSRGTAIIHELPLLVKIKKTIRLHNFTSARETPAATVILIINTVHAIYSTKPQKISI